MSDQMDMELSVLSGFDFFKGLSREEIKAATANSWIKSLKHREFLYRAGDGTNSFCIVLNGALKLIRHSPRGDDVIVHFAIQGDLVGALLMNRGEETTYPVSAKAMGPTKVMCIPRSTFLSFWQNHVQLQNRLNSVLYRRMSSIQDDKALFSAPLRNRIAVLLMRHLDQTEGAEEQPLSLSLTRQEIADSLGVAVESVIRIMSDWSSEGTIHRLSPKGPELINIEKLLSNIE